MKIGCLQFAPVKGEVNNNLSRADAVLLKENAEGLDLLVLPELAFSGTSECSLHQLPLVLPYPIIVHQWWCYSCPENAASVSLNANTMINRLPLSIPTRHLSPPRTNRIRYHKPLGSHYRLEIWL